MADRDQEQFKKQQKAIKRARALRELRKREQEAEASALLERIAKENERKNREGK